MHKITLFFLQERTISEAVRCSVGVALSFQKAQTELGSFKPQFKLTLKVSGPLEQRTI